MLLLASLPAAAMTSTLRRLASASASSRAWAGRDPDAGPRELRLMTVCAVVGGPGDAARLGVVNNETLVIGHLDGQHGRVVARAGHADSITRRRGGHTSHKRAMPDGVGDVGRSIHGVVLVDHLADEIGVGEIDPGVDHGNPNIGRAVLDIPRIRCVDLCQIGRLLGIVGIVGCADQLSRLGDRHGRHPGLRRQGGDRCLHLCLGHLDRHRH